MMRNALLLILYAACVTASNVAIKISAGAGSFWPFILPFGAGNIAGLGGALIYTLLLRSMPLHAAFPLTRGVGVLAVQLAASVLVALLLLGNMAANTTAHIFFKRSAAGG
jgi:multidrug transporter EmrE-like cation transporter